MKETTKIALRNHALTDNERNDMTNPTPEEFNKYCADVMHVNKAVADYLGEYNPYDDLNQLAEVVEKLLDSAYTFYLAKLSSYVLDTKGIKQAFRDFIISTMEELDND